MYLLCPPLPPSMIGLLVGYMMADNRDPIVKRLLKLSDKDRKMLVTSIVKMVGSHIVYDLKAFVRADHGNWVAFLRQVRDFTPRATKL